MVRQFESEKRGLSYVKEAKLVQRISDPLYSPHYPMRNLRHYTPIVHTAL